MSLFIVCHLLLMTLLSQPTEENAEGKPSTAPEPDTQSVHFGEFCLHTADGSRWTSSAPVTQLPTKSANPTRHATQTPEQPRTEPTPPFGGSTQEPDLTTDFEGSGGHIGVANAPLLSSQAISGCYCEDKEKKVPSEIFEFLNIMMWFPTEACKSAEFIGRLADGTEVCLITPSLSAFYKELFHHRSAPTAEPSIYEEPSVTSPAPLDPTTELPTTTQPSVTEIKQVHDPNPQTVFPSIEEYADMAYDSVYEGSGKEDAEVTHNCEFCHSTMSLDNVDPKAVQSLSAKMQSSPCPVLIHVSLNGDTDFCLYSIQLEFKAILKKLDIPPTHEDDIAKTPKNIIDGCRCKERQQKHPTETSVLTSTTAWLPSATCSSTEFIETLTDGSEVCVTAPSLSAYFEFLLCAGGAWLRARREVTATGPKEEIYVLGGHVEDDRPVLVHTVDSIVTFHEKKLIEFDPPAVVDTMEDREEMCMTCPFDLRNLDPKDVQFLEMIVPSPGCPVFIDVTLKHGGFFCVDSSQPWFSTVLENLEI